MRPVLKAAVLLCLVSPCSLLPAYGHPPAIVGGPAEKALVEEVADFRKRVAKAVSAKDAAVVRTLYADSYRHTEADGVVADKAARLAVLRSGAVVIETAPAEDVVISVPNGWAAVATGRSRIGNSSVRWTVTYVRAGESWLVAAAQETRITAR